MKITPLEIRQKAFEKTLRGYDKDEVNAFLLMLSQQWERTQDEAKEMKIKCDTAEREVVKLREVENTLYRTLKTAEDTGANVIDQANKSAELHLRESQMRAESLLNEAKSRARSIIEDAEQTTRQLLEEMEEKLKGLADQYKTMELHRDNLLADIKRFAGETLDRVERAKNNSKEFNPDSFLAAAKREAKKVVFPKEVEMTVRKVLSPAPVPAPAPEPEPKPEREREPEKVPVFADSRAPKSFFDDIQ